MYLKTCLPLFFFISYSVKMLENLWIKEECFGMFLGESTRFQIKCTLPSKPMNLAWMSSFYIISCNFEFWYSTNSWLLSEEYIRLIDTCRDLSIRHVDLRHSFDRQMSIIRCNRKEKKLRGYLISKYIRRHSKYWSWVEYDSWSGKFWTTGDLDISCQWSSRFRYTTILNCNICIDRYFDIRHFTWIKEYAIWVNVNFCSINKNFFHKKSIENTWKNAICFF